MKAILTLALALSLFGSQPAYAAGDVITLEFSWKGRTYSAGELPSQLDETSVEAIKTWTPWCQEHKYQMDLVADQRVLLISRKGNKAVSKRLKLIDETEKEFDKILPAPKRQEKKDEGEESQPTAPKDLPEDPEGGPVGFSPTRTGSGPAAPSWSSSWGAGTWPVDSETCVMFVVKNEKEYGSLVRTIGEMEEYLAGWVDFGMTQTGFVHEKPLVGAYIENAEGVEEWDPENELVHRVAHMLFVRRFSSVQPFWLIQGVSWHLENAIRETIYVYPYRHEFVFATEHTAWPNDLKNIFEGRGATPIELHEVSEWRRGTYDGIRARVAFGLVNFLAKYHGDDLSAFAEGMRLHALTDSKEYEEDGVTWKFKPNYAISTEDQYRFVVENFGEFCLLDAAESFREGKKYKVKKRKKTRGK